MSMDRRALKYSSNYVVLTIIILAIIGIINGISARHFLRLDLTENKEYTISKASKKVAEGLDDLVSVTVYFSKDLPPYLMNLRNQVRDILAEYSAFSNGKVKVKWEDPGLDEEAEQRMMRLGIPKLQLNIIAKDKQELTAAYMGIVIMFEDRKEVIPVVRNIGNLEYDVTSALLKVVSSESKMVGIFTNEPAPQMPQMGQEQKYAELRRQLSKSYTVQDVTFTDGRPLPKEMKTLLVISPEATSEWAKYQIDQFMMRGGQVVFMMNPVKLDNGLQAQPLKTNLEDLMTFYGVKMSHDLVADQRNSMAQFNSGYVRFALPYPFWPKITQKSFAAENPIVSELESLVTPWTGYLSPIQANLGANKLELLVNSSDRAWLVREGEYNLNPQQRWNPPAEDIKTYPLAGMVRGQFNSFYKGKQQPPKPEAQPDQPAPPPEEDLPFIETSVETVATFIANSNLIDDQFAQLFPSNLVFILNLIDYMTMGEDLIGIRSRAVSERPIDPELSNSAKQTLKLINLLGVSILVIIIGVARMMIIRSKRRLISQGGLV